MSRRPKPKTKRAQPATKAAGKPRRKRTSRKRRASAARPAAPNAASPTPRPKPTSTPSPAALQPGELDALREQLEARIAEAAMPARWNPEPDEVRRAVMKLVLTIAEFIRQVLERQAVRRMEAQTLTPEQVEAVGLALMRLEEALNDLAKQSGLDPAELNLDLGPLGRLL